MTTDTDHALTFALAGRLYFDGDRIVAIVEIQHGGTFIGSPVMRGNESWVIMPDDEGTAIFESHRLDELADKPPITITTQAVEVEARLPWRLLAWLQLKSRERA